MEAAMTEWNSRFGLAGKRALVTGATKGIGLETCKVLADAGADIAAVGRDAQGLKEVASAITKSGRKCVSIQADMAKTEDITRTAKEAMAGLGQIDILVNNAGIALIDPLLTATAEDWDMTMAVNLRAPFLLARALVPGMIERKQGKIINISSQAGVVGLEAHGAYAASKGGLNMLTKVMTVEWAKFNIQINSVCPTVILTPMGEQVWGQPEKGDPMKAKIPAARFGKPIEVADLVLFLASSASDLINGQDILIDGGYTAV
jgi:NAD(P)-dependent dehydrogenase (short-subunit alcohol dehydrogenase family)